MISRYTRPQMGAVWNDQNKFQQWLEVELAASEALAQLGVVPADAAAALRANAGFDVGRINEIESVVKHDVIAFTTAVAETMKERGHAEALDVPPPRRASSRQKPAVGAYYTQGGRCRRSSSRF